MSISNVIAVHSVLLATSMLDVTSLQFVAQVQTLWALDKLKIRIKVHKNHLKNLSKLSSQKHFNFH